MVNSCSCFRSQAAWPSILYWPILAEKYNVTFKVHYCAFATFIDSDIGILFHFFKVKDLRGDVAIGLHPKCPSQGNCPAEVPALSSNGSDD